MSAIQSGHYPTHSIRGRAGRPDAYYLAAEAGFFYDRHRAESDCLAAIELLASLLPNSGVTAMARLLERARQPSWRIWAENAPFDLKDILKARGYRWNGDSNPNPRAWYIDVEQAQRDAEIEYLRKEIYQRDIDFLVHRMDAYNRYSDRRDAGRDSGAALGNGEQ